MAERVRACPWASIRRDVSAGFILSVGHQLNILQSAGPTRSALIPRSSLYSGREPSNIENSMLMPGRASCWVREAAKKVIFVVGRPLSGGGGSTGLGLPKEPL